MTFFGAESWLGVKVLCSLHNMKIIGMAVTPNILIGEKSFCHNAIYI